MSLSQAISDLVARHGTWEGTAQQLWDEIRLGDSPLSLAKSLAKHEEQLLGAGFSIRRELRGRDRERVRLIVIAGSDASDHPIPDEPIPPGNLIPSDPTWDRAVGYPDFDFELDSRLQQALHLDRCGLSLVPIRWRDKRPSTAWETYQERRPTVIELGRWLARPSNLAIACGAISGVVVVDLDSPQALAWAEAHLPPTPIRCFTGTKALSDDPEDTFRGQHWYYRHPGQAIGNRARVNTAEGPLALDIRGDGGYVLAPGSHHPSGAVYWAYGSWLPQDFQALPLYPTHLLTSLISDDVGGSPPQSSPTPIGRDHLAESRPDLRSRAVAYMATRKPAIQGQSGDSLTFTTATALVRGFCLPDDIALELLQEWNRACVPPWSDKQLRSKIRSAHKSGREPYGYLIGDEERRDSAPQPRAAAPGGSETPKASSAVGGSPTRSLDSSSPALDVTISPLGTLNNDEGNARAFIHHHKGVLRFCHDLNSWYLWGGTRWERDDAQRHKWHYVEYCHWRQELALDDKTHQRWSTALNSGKATAALTMAQCYPEVAIKLDRFDSDPWVINCPNGTLNLKTAELLEHDRGRYLTKEVGVAYDASATCPQWRRFLLEIMGNDQELVDYLQRVIGYLLTGDTSEEAFFFLYGIGANGKSTFLEVVKALLGDYGKSAEFSTFTEDADKGGARPDLVNLIGARLVMANEAGQGKVLDTGLLKKMTGRDTMACRDLYKGMVEFTPVWKIFLVANHKPTIKDSSIGTWRRLHLVPFTVTVPEERQDKQLRTKLLEELPGILNWALAGCQWWQRVGLAPPRKITEAGKEYQSEMDPVGRFLADCCVTGHYDRYETAAGKLFEAYVEWCEDSGEKPWSQTAFGRGLRAKGYEQLIGGRGNQRRRVWRGIGLLSDVPDPGDKIQQEMF